MSTRTRLVRQKIDRMRDWWVANVCQKDVAAAAAAKRNRIDNGTLRGGKKCNVW